MQFIKENYVNTTLGKSLILVFISIYVGLNAQQNNKSPYHGGLKLGCSIHTMTGDLTKTQPGGNLLGGFWFQLKMNKKWTAQTELLLLDKGIGIRETGKSPHFVNLHYFEIPVLFQYQIKLINFEFGPGLAYLINYRENLYANQTPDLVNNYPFMRSEASFNVGISCELIEKLTLGLRLSHSLLPVRGAVPLVSEETYNRLLALSVTHQIKKKKAIGRKE